MEIEDEDGATIVLSNGRNNNKAVFGRESGFVFDDRTVSRRHVAFELENGAKQKRPRVSFEVLGKNPVWVRRNEEEGVMVFRCSEKGELSEGDRFCLSGNEPNWFTLRKIRTQDWEPRALDEEDESELGTSSRSSEFEDFDVSDYDPVKEFGFVVMGHEFDIYPKNMVRGVKRWDWFLEENRKESSDSDEEEFEKRKKKGAKRKRKKGEENDDEDWTGEGEDDTEIVGTGNKSHRREHSARLEDGDKQPRKDAQARRKSTGKQIDNSNGNDDEEDETLGGFIVGDDDVDQEEEETNGEDEQEEFVEDDDEEDEYE